MFSIATHTPGPLAIESLLPATAALTPACTPSTRRPQQQQGGAKGAPKPFVNPFLPYEEALWVAHLSGTHTLLLNKFNVVEKVRWLVLLHVYILTLVCVRRSSCYPQFWCCRQLAARCAWLLHAAAARLCSCSLHTFARSFLSLAYTHTRTHTRAHAACAGGDS